MAQKRATKTRGGEKTSDHLDSNPVFTALDRLEAEKRQKKKEKKPQNQPSELVMDDVEDIEDIEDVDQYHTQEDARRAKASTSTLPMDKDVGSPPRLTAAEKGKAPVKVGTLDIPPTPSTPTPATMQKTLAEALSEYRGDDPKPTQQENTDATSGNALMAWVHIGAHGSTYVNLCEPGRT
ncbi:hypothetical protein CYLTODRAFT_459050 [Cylindrobasidium torrendii FP15055 ss-10]|uniref:Uncharacterized protein n=1 Tax=Cylindrobasidium torrendii FP15055 ss-10 TaxID=1314674 RepID=A0A0D7AVG0_9AGAR|nr:hypothetical protein CYLTODRAFT_459050 [Cylindrobasidium torrendii FP15055 ss-10]